MGRAVLDRCGALVPRQSARLTPPSRNEKGVCVSTPALVRWGAPPQFGKSVGRNINVSPMSQVGGMLAKMRVVPRSIRLPFCDCLSCGIGDQVSHLDEGQELTSVLN